MALLERDHQLALLRGLLAEAAGGRGRLAALAGEAGVGKTALTQALSEAAPEGTRILRGACEDLVVAEPLGPQAGGAHAR
jgi:predicted ATPase